MRFDGLRRILLTLCLAAPAAAGAQTAGPPVEAPSFTIERFEILGSGRLPRAEIDPLLAAHAGPARTFADVQRAVAALEALYRQHGYVTVYVAVPEQELEKGVVRLRVVEGKIAKVLVEGNTVFSEENIRASLPQLQEGELPVARRIAENLQLANENPAKQIDVILAAGDSEGEVNARVRVRDEKPWRVSAMLDNTGTALTGKERLGVMLQHHNLFDADHGASLGYITSPAKPAGVAVDVYSLGYRLPLYALGDSVELFYVNAQVGVADASPSLAGGLGIVGKGEVYRARYNLLLPRQDEYSSWLVVGLDESLMQSACTLPGGGALTGVAGCEDYRSRPLSLTYAGRLGQIERTLDLSLGAARNLYASSERSYQLASGNRNASTHFAVWRLDATLSQSLPADFRLRLAGQGQMASGPLLPSEQIGLAGSRTVRGFSERAVASDQGYVVQSELYTPNLAGRATSLGSMRALAFFDFASGRNFDVPAGQASRTNIASAGLGLRYDYDKNLHWGFDLARIIDSHTAWEGAAPVDTGWRGHFSVKLAY